MSPTIKYAVSIVVILVLIFNVVMNHFSFDNVSLILLIISLLPWMPGWIRSLKFGNFEVQFHQLGDEVNRQKSEINQQQQIISEVVMYSMSESVYTHLWKINDAKENDGEYKFSNNEPFAREMYYLRDSGYIESEGPGFLDFNAGLEGKNLAELVKLTPIAERIIELRGNPK